MMKEFKGEIVYNQEVHAGIVRGVRETRQRYAEGLCADQVFITSGGRITPADRTLNGYFYDYLDFYIRRMAYM